MINLVGKTIVAVRGFSTDRRHKTFTPQYIMFDDQETYIELEDQDYYTYHDCSTSAKEIQIYHNKQMWEEIMNNLKDYPNATEDGV